MNNLGTGVYTIGPQEFDGTVTFLVENSISPGESVTILQIDVEKEGSGDPDALIERMAQTVIKTLETCDVAGWSMLYRPTEWNTQVGIPPSGEFEAGCTVEEVTSVLRGEFANLFVTGLIDNLREKIIADRAAASKSN